MAMVTKNVAVLLCALLVIVLSCDGYVPKSMYRPVVLWHGMGDSCCNPDSMGAVMAAIQRELGSGVYVHSIMLGADEKADRRAGFFGNLNEQVANVCRQLKADENLQYGFNAIGFSQGGQFLRAYVQRCNDPPVHNLITFGSQHQGVADLPPCGSNDFLCRLMHSIAMTGVYTSYIQSHVVQAQYFKDPKRLELYLERNIFLPDINNELPVKNKTYKENLASLNWLVLIRFTKDQTVVPPESSWFFSVNGEGEVEDLYGQPYYTEDWLGLRTLNESGRLEFLECEGKHMEISVEYLITKVVRPYLKDPIVPYDQSPKLTIQQ